MEPLLRFDEVYSVSDLHLGGTPGFQIFDQGEVLAGVIDLLREYAPDRRIALVLNGDIVDFLAEDGAAYLSPQAAVPMLERIFRDPAFAPVWQALSRFVKTPRRRLVLVLGNHDVELALPQVRLRLAQELCGEDDAARGRIVTAMDGSGFSCLVGSAQVLCMHGNEVDPWNLIDYEALRKVARAQNSSRAPDAWDPNAGTQLVIDVMNRIKRRFPFVDLLKPETKVVAPIVLAVDPTVIAQLAKLAPVVFRLMRGTAKQSGFLSSGEEASEGANQRRAEEIALQMFGGTGKAMRPNTAAEALALLTQAERDFESGLSAMDLAAEIGQSETLGVGQYLLDRVMGVLPEEALRRALSEWLKDDTTFEFNTVDEVYTALDESAGSGVDYLLAGHTHLARALPRKGGGIYFNSGTWIRLIHLTSAMLENLETFQPVYKALTAGGMAALDAAKVASRPLVLRRPTVTRVVAEAGGHFGELTRAVVQKGRVVLVPEPNTRFGRS